MKGQLFQIKKSCLLHSKLDFNIFKIFELELIVIHESDIIFFGYLINYLDMPQLNLMKKDELDKYSLFHNNFNHFLYKSCMLTFDDKKYVKIYGNYFLQKYIVTFITEKQCKNFTENFCKK